MVGPRLLSCRPTSNGAPPGASARGANAASCGVMSHPSGDDIAPTIPTQNSPTDSTAPATLVRMLKVTPRFICIMLFSTRLVLEISLCKRIETPVPAPSIRLHVPSSLLPSTVWLADRLVTCTYRCLTAVRQISTCHVTQYWPKHISCASSDRVPGSARRAPCRHSSSQTPAGWHPIL